MTRERLTWRPIETAPRDGTRVLVWDGCEHHVSRYDAGWVDPICSERGGIIEPTHWMPLPSPPSPIVDVPRNPGTPRAPQAGGQLLFHVRAYLQRQLEQGLYDGVDEQGLYDGVDELARFWHGTDRSEPTRILLHAPQFRHDCDRCEFLGRAFDEHGEPADLWRCDKAPTGETFIARRGHDGPDYMSGPAEMHPLLWEAASRYRDTP